jgi:hypothetical protein
VLFGSLYVLGTRANARVEPPALKAEAQPAAVRVVEVPVVEERVVTRTVYVEKKERAAGRDVSTRNDGREALAARNDKDGRDAAPLQKQEEAEGAGSHAGYFTRVDMNDFQPADEMKIRIVSRGTVNEK